MKQFVLFRILFVLCLHVTIMCNIPVYAAVSGESFSPEQSIQRAKIWVQKEVTYSRSPRTETWHEGYRPDCSGFVSMAWGLPGPGLSTWGLEKISTEIKKEELKAGDILLNTVETDYPHVVLFGGWTNKQHTTYHAYEENGYYEKAREDAKMPYPYYSGFDTEKYVPRRYDPKKVKNPVKIVSIKPGGMWNSPKEGQTVGDILTFSARAYPTKPDDPKIAKVHFTIRSNNSWSVACTVKKPISDDTYVCEVNLKELDIAYGKIQASFDVEDEKGNINLAPHGVINLTHSPEPVPAPTKKTDFSRFVGLWKMHATFIKIEADGSADYQGRTYLNCDTEPPPCDDYSGNHGGTLMGIQTKIKFTRVQNDSAYRTIISGTGIRIDTGDKGIIPVGSPFSVTLTSMGLRASDGRTFVRCTPESQDMACTTNT